jgi:flagellar biosynthesis/type III secretory pathway protein FliH
MVLMKAAEFNQGTPGNQVFNLNDIAEEAQGILEQARRERQSLLQQVRQEIKRERQQAQEEGYRTGQEQGLQEGRKTGYDQALQNAREEFTQRSVSVCKNLEAICTEFDRCKKELLWQTEQNAVALILAIARKVVKQAGLLHREVATDNIKSALELLNKTTNVIVQIHPQDAEHVEKMVESASSPFADYANIAFEKEESIETGGCRLITEQGRIDGQLDTQVDRIAQELLITAVTNENDVLRQATGTPGEEADE